MQRKKLRPLFLMNMYPNDYRYIKWDNFKSQTRISCAAKKLEAFIAVIQR